MASSDKFRIAWKDETQWKKQRWLEDWPLGDSAGYQQSLRIPVGREINILFKYFSAIPEDLYVSVSGRLFGEWRVLLKSE